MSTEMITPSGLFSIANMVALAGWAVLALGVAFKSKILKETIAGVIVPLALSIGYTVLIAAYWSRASGSFSSLDGVVALFQSPWMLLAGWIHYLAFDLFVGAWIARDAETRALPSLLLFPVLPAVFLFGPAGLLLWLGLRTAFRARSTTL